MGMPNVYMLQQDNDSKHTFELNMKWLLWNIPKPLKMPAQPQDLKPTERVWAILKRGDNKKNVKSKGHLKRVLIQEWDAINKNLVNSMHRRFVLLLELRALQPNTEI